MVENPDNWLSDGFRDALPEEKGSEAVDNAATSMDLSSLYACCIGWRMRGGPTRESNGAPVKRDLRLSRALPNIDKNANGPHAHRFAHLQ